MGTETTCCPCYWGFKTTGNKVAWVLLGIFLAIGVTLSVWGTVEFVDCFNKAFKPCKDNDLDFTIWCPGTDECYFTTKDCARIANDICHIRKWAILSIAGYAFIGLMTFPMFYFCCCASIPKDANGVPVVAPPANVVYPQGYPPQGPGYPQPGYYPGGYPPLPYPSQYPPPYPGQQYPPQQGAPQGSPQVSDQQYPVQQYPQQYPPPPPPYQQTPSQRQVADDSHYTSGVTPPPAQTSSLPVQSLDDSLDSAQRQASRGDPPQQQQQQQPGDQSAQRASANGARVNAMFI